MIVYPLSATEARIVRWIVPSACCLLAFAASLCLICDLNDWLEGLIPLFAIGIDA